jgi:transposase InsO family protein
MQEDGLVARARKRYKGTTMSDHDQPVAANLLDRAFTADRPNQRWVGDTTQFVIEESGTPYLAAILDLFSRFIVGWAVSAVNDRHLTIKALDARPISPAAYERQASRAIANVTVVHGGILQPPSEGERRSWDIL